MADRFIWSEDLLYLLVIELVEMGHCSDSSRWRSEGAHGQVWRCDQDPGLHRVGRRSPLQLLQRWDEIRLRGWDQLWGNLDRNVRAYRRHGPPWAHQADSRFGVQNSGTRGVGQEDSVAHWGFGCLTRRNMGGVQARWRIATQGDTGILRFIHVCPRTWWTWEHPCGQNGPRYEKMALAILSQAAFLHTNYSRNPELSWNNLAILPVIDSSKNKNSCCS